MSQFLVNKVNILVNIKKKKKAVYPLEKGNTEILKPVKLCNLLFPFLFRQLGKMEMQEV